MGGERGDEMTNYSPTWDDIDAREWLMRRMEDHRNNALAALRALPPEQVASVLCATLPGRTDLSEGDLRRLIDTLGPMHQEAWAENIKKAHDRAEKRA